ncbi:MAG TPA: hypothetical protein VK436_15870 [Methanocella sp.]|nr:hypothetical protein [Methanocella sp.]
MKLRVFITIALIFLLFSTTVYAAKDRIFYPSQKLLQEDSGIIVEIDHIKLSDTSIGYSPFNFPPTEYKFYTLYYYISNPTNDSIKYEFRIHFADDQGREYTSEEYNLAEVVNPHSRGPEQKEFAVYRNASGVYLRWDHINHYYNTMETTNISLIEDLGPTATPAASPKATVIASATVSPTSAPTTSPTVAPSTLSPYITIMSIAIGAGAISLISGRLRRQ